ncbi:hypothetical protein ACIGAN_30720 [Streptomyces sp. NPDC085931]|uniref:hypothetical protein n=1 Tax=Streptomyces sp. NPDC085931 TaxID=3365740 RepID=UPI0037D1502E
MAAAAAFRDRAAAFASRTARSSDPPTSSRGPTAIALADVDRARFFRRLVVYGGIVVAVVPAVARTVMVGPRWG